jgi:hypothetical protein
MGQLAKSTDTNVSVEKRIGKGRQGAAFGLLAALAGLIVPVQNNPNARHVARFCGLARGLGGF